MAQLSDLTPDLASRRYPDFEILITKEAVEKFFESVAYPEPPGEVIPHSFYSCLKEAEFIVFADLGIELQQLLHVSQSYEYYAHLKVGDQLTSRSGILKISSRKMGEGLVVFMEMENKFYRRGEMVARAVGTVIVRELR